MLTRCKRKRKQVCVKTEYPFVIDNLEKREFPAVTAAIYTFPPYYLHFVDSIYRSITALPTDTNNWNRQLDLVQRVYKARICSFEADTILWPKGDGDLESWFDAQSQRARHAEKQGCRITASLEYIDKVLAFADVDLKTWYEGKSDLILQTYTHLLHTLLVLNDPGEDKSSVLKSLVLERIRDWVLILKTILESPQALLCEKSHEECFVAFARTADLRARSGDVYKCEVGYPHQHDQENQEVVHTVTSTPDVILCKPNVNYMLYGVAVVKVMQRDFVDWNEVVHREIVSTSEPQLSTSSAEKTSVAKETSAAKRVKTSTKKVKFSDQEAVDPLDAPLVKARYGNGHPRMLTDAQRTRCESFLPQLLGEAAAAENIANLKFHQVPLGDGLHSMIGIGVVGFDVHFVNFIGVQVGLTPARAIRDIPITRGAGLDILISEPLSLLVRQDRNKVLKLLFALDSIQT